MTFPGVGFFGPRKWPAQYMPAQITSATPNMKNIGRYCASIVRLRLWEERAGRPELAGRIPLARVRSSPHTPCRDATAKRKGNRNSAPGCKKAEKCRCFER